MTLQRIISPIGKCGFVVGQLSNSWPNFLRRCLQDPKKSDTIMKKSTKHHLPRASDVPRLYDTIFFQFHILPKYSKQLIDLAVTLEERLLRCHFGEYTSDAPDIDCARVTARSEKNLWRSIPQGNNLVCVNSHGDTEGSAQTKIGNFDSAAFVDQQILRFQIAMQHSPHVTE